MAQSCKACIIVYMAGAVQATNPEQSIMKTTKGIGGGYQVTGYTRAGELVQYTVSKNGSGWAVDLVYGKGAVLNMLYPTKAAAVQAIENQV